MMYKDQDFFETVLLKGSVEVNETTTGRKVKLQPNERLFGKAGQLRKESINEWNRALWMQGILYFDNTRMDEIIRQLGLYYDVKFILEKESLDKCTVHRKISYQRRCRTRIKGASTEM